MNRRNFLRSMVGGVAVAAAVRAFPFRVYSFPTEVVAPTFDQITSVTLAGLRKDVLFDNFFVDTPWLRKLRAETPLTEFVGGWRIVPPFSYEVL